jgi:hypothetical protein
VYGSPANVPEVALLLVALVGVAVADADGLAAGLFDAAALCVGAALCVAATEGWELFVVTAAVFASVVFFTTGEDVALAAGLTVASGVAVALSVVETGARSSPPPRLLVVLPICGGVIAKTAPNPPTVPPAINSARFISVLSLLYL